MSLLIVMTGEIINGSVVEISKEVYGEERFI